MDTKELLKIVAENPDLPIVPLVDSDVICDYYGRCLGKIGSVRVGEYAVYAETLFTNRDVFKSRYRSDNKGWLSKYTKDYAESILDKVSDIYFIKAIIVEIDWYDQAQETGRSNYGY